MTFITCNTQVLKIRTPTQAYTVPNTIIKIQKDIPHIQYTIYYMYTLVRKNMIAILTFCFGIKLLKMAMNNCIELGDSLAVLKSAPSNMYVNIIL